MIHLDSSSIGESTRNFIGALNGQRYSGKAKAGDVVIRWGSGMGLGYPRGVRVLNRHLMWNKRTQGLALMEAGVSFPRLYLTREDWVADGKPTLIMKPEEGEAGRGIKLAGSRPTWEYGFIYQKYIDKKREFRVGMVGDIFGYALEKLPPTNGDVRWNSCRGSEWVGVQGLYNLQEKFRVLGRDALAAIGYEIGGIDMMMDSSGKLYIIEVNSKPGLGPQNAMRLANAIREFLKR